MAQSCPNPRSVLVCSGCGRAGAGSGWVPFFCLGSVRECAAFSNRFRPWVFSFLALAGAASLVSDGRIDFQWTVAALPEPTDNVIFAGCTCGLAGMRLEILTRHAAGRRLQSVPSGHLYEDEMGYESHVACLISEMAIEICWGVAFNNTTIEEEGPINHTGHLVPRVYTPARRSSERRIGKRHSAYGIQVTIHYSIMIHLYLSQLLPGAYCAIIR
jgi:hypothetical protein